MDRFFFTILNMSLTGSFVILVICLARLPLKKAPKIISYCLWAVAFLRLAFPFSIEAAYSLIPIKAQTIPPDITMLQTPRIDSGMAALDNIVSGALPAAAPSDGANPLQIWAAACAFFWLLGLAIMLLYGVASYFLVRYKLIKSSRAVSDQSNIVVSDRIQSPFVLGLITPRVYIPAGLSEKEREYIILHEQTHIRRLDHVVRFFSYLILCFHWFNPLAWAAYLLMGVDMEMSCDESVLKSIGGDIKKDYSLLLLSLASDRRYMNGSPLAFGEDGVRNRIKNVLNFKGHSRAVILISVAFVAALSLGFAFNRTGTGAGAGAGTGTGAEAIGAGGAGDVSGDNLANGASGTGEGAAASGAGEGTDASGAGGNSSDTRTGAGAGGEPETSESARIFVSDSATGATYIIADYYNDEGQFSELGLALEVIDDERRLRVKGGDILAAGDRRYRVIVESLEISFYTQPSLGAVMQWWVDYLDSWAESRKLTPLD